MTRRKDATGKSAQRVSRGNRRAGSEHVKFAISMPRADFERIEAARGRLELSRSKFVLAAIRRWLVEAEEQIAIRQYVAGYQATPEDEQLMMVMEKIQAETVSQEDW